MFRLKANKTGLYKLVGEFEELPPMRQVTITKAYRAPDWWLKWTDADGLLWDEVFQRTYCAACSAENCDAENCPHQAERNSPAWFLAKEVADDGKDPLW